MGLGKPPTLLFQTNNTHSRLRIVLYFSYAQYARARQDIVPGLNPTFCALICEGIFARFMTAGKADLSKGC